VARTVRLTGPASLGVRRFCEREQAVDVRVGIVGDLLGGAVETCAHFVRCVVVPDGAEPETDAVELLFGLVGL
jgi:hypothetical protein